MTLFSPRDLLLRTIYTREGGSNQILGTRFVKNPRQVKNHFSPLLFQVTHSSWSWIFEGLFELTQCSARPCPPFLNPLYTLLSSDNIAIFQACLAERAKHAIIISFFTLLVSVSHTVKWHFSSVTENLRAIVTLFLEGEVPCTCTWIWHTVG